MTSLICNVLNATIVLIIIDCLLFTLSMLYDCWIGSDDFKSAQLCQTYTGLTKSWSSYIAVPDYVVWLIITENVDCNTCILYYLLGGTLVKCGKCKKNVIVIWFAFLVDQVTLDQQ